MKNELFELINFIIIWIRYIDLSWRLIIKYIFSHNN
jgi:hypothetical protein